MSEQQSASTGPDTRKRLATQLRVDSIRSTTMAGSGHRTSSLSAADLLAVLLASHLRCDLEQPRALGIDQLIFSKGHAAPLKAAGAISDTQLMTLRERGSVIDIPRRDFRTSKSPPDRSVTDWR